MKSKVSPAIVVGAILALLTLLTFWGIKLLSGDGSTDKEYKINVPSPEERNRNAPAGLGGGG